MTRPRASWQHPALAPVYAAVIAFAVVAVVRVSEVVKSAPGPDITVTVRVSPSTSSVCLVLPDGWRFADPKASATPTADPGTSGNGTPSAGAPAAVLPKCGPAGDETEFSTQLRAGGS